MLIQRLWLLSKESFFDLIRDGGRVVDCRGGWRTLLQGPSVLSSSLISTVKSRGNINLHFTSGPLNLRKHEY